MSRPAPEDQPLSSASVAPYPVPPGSRRSAVHRVRVEHRPVFVERFASVGYARFAVDGPVRVEVAVAGPIRGHAVFPAGRVTSTAIAGSVLLIELPAPRSVVVWIDDLEPLFLLPDAIEHDRPDPADDGVFDVTDFGADPAGRTLATAQLQAAIDAATSRAGGGTVLIPAGCFVTGTLNIRSDVSLYLAPGALLQGSADPADYPLDPGRHESAGDSTLAPDVRNLGRTMTFSRLLLVDQATNVRIAGRGTIDGHGASLRSDSGIAPNLLRVRASSKVVVEDVLFRNSAAWSLHLLASDRVTVRNVKVINDRTTLNTDGIDPDMSSDVTIDGAFIYTKDDAICVKASGNGDLAGDPRRILATNNLVSAVDAGLKVGSESSAATFSDIRFEGNHVFDSGRAMSIVVRDGATYEHVAFRRIEVGPRVGHLVEQVIGVRDPAAALGSIRDLAFEDVRAADYRPPPSNWTWYAQFRPGRPRPGEAVNAFEGADPEHAVDGLRLAGVVVNGEHLHDLATAARVAGLTIGPHVRRVTFDRETLD